MKISNEEKSLLFEVFSAGYEYGYQKSEDNFGNTKGKPLKESFMEWYKKIEGMITNE